ncbi:MAG: hypothetical protein LBO77_03225 [Desulfovibrio sp.]|jgi:hypothetical protein|nr:hypothetical protein [Desulfovibrio sp.]
MRPSGRPGELFDAFSRITGRALADDRLLACPVLSKAPHQGDILGRFLRREPYPPLGPAGRVRLAARYCLTNGGHFCFLLLTRLFLVLLRWRLPWAVLRAKDAPPAAILDTFALLPGLARDGGFKEGYLPGLDRALQQEGHIPVRLYRLYGSRRPRVLWKALRVLAAAGPGITEAGLFSWSDWFRLLWHCLAYPPALYRLIRSLDGADPASPEAWIRGALVRTAGQNVLDGEARRLAGLRLGAALASLPRTSRLISWYENQTGNKALCRGLSQAERLTGRHIPCVGAQLFIWPDTLLNNHPDDGEAALGLAPDLVLVNGPFFLPEKTIQNYATGPSLRYGHLFAPLAAAEESGPLLVLLSYHPKETARVLDLVLPLARAGRALAYRFHPAVRAEEFASRLPPSPALADGPLIQALRSCGAVIGAGSGSLAEAAALDLPVIQAEDPSGIPGLGLNYLPPCGRGRLWEAVRQTGDIEPALLRLRACRAHPAHAAEVAAFRDLLFTAPTPEAVRRAFLA